MIFKLWHKLVLTIIGITGIVLILSLYISDQSVKKGFLSYINQVESNRLNGLVSNLVEGYQEDNNWEFIRGNRRLWHRYNQRSNSPLPNNNIEVEQSIPRLNDLVKKEGNSQRRQRLPDRPKNRPPRDRELEDQERPNQKSKHRPPPRRGDNGERRRPPPRRNSKPPPLNLVLLDANQEYVMGGG